MRVKNVCVFCGARDSVALEYIELATKCGEMLVSNGLHLVYGGGGTGMMGAISKAVSDKNGKVIGIYPKILDALEPLNLNLENTILVDNMFERKELMIRKSDAFVILPGGFGTLDEIFEVITLKVLKQHNKPIIICNYKNYWESLIKCCENIIHNNFARKHANASYQVVEDLEGIFQALA